MEIFSSFENGDMLLLYFCQDGIYDFTLIPRSMNDNLVPHRGGISTTTAAKHICKTLKFEFPSLQAESLIQFKISGTPYEAQHGCGTSLRNAPCIKDMKFLSQKKTGKRIVTSFEYKKGLFFDHIAELHDGWLRVHTEVRNDSASSVKFDYLASFSLGMLSPFQSDNGSGKYFVYRMQSHWSNEGRLEELSAERAGLEMSWQAAGYRGLRFGQRSTMPIKDYFPFAAFEDRENGVIWGGMLEAAGAWEMEISRFCDAVNISGGCPDREFNGWTCQLAPGGTYSTMPGILSCVKGDVQDLCSRLTLSQTEIPSGRKAEADLPPLFNEFCTSWGKPEEDKVLPQLNAVKDLGLRYFVLDAGWYFEDDEHGAPGDWILNEDLYHGSFDAFLDQVRKAGMIPGIWFEFEVADQKALIIKQHPEYFITLDGARIINGTRSFLDLRRSDVRTYLHEKVVSFLRKHNIGYMKVDYNACVSLGCDGADSPVQNLLDYTKAVRSFFDEIRIVLPNLTLEICASGGHRLSPDWIRYADMASFSDAHEGLEIPIIAVDVQKMIALSKSQVWAVLRKGDGQTRLHYTLASALIGRLCLSGDVSEMTADEIQTIGEGVEFYKAVTPLIANGKSRVEQQIGDIRSNPTGWQIFSRTGENAQYAVIHTFRNAPEKIVFSAMPGAKLVRSFASPALKWSFRDGQLSIENPGEMEGAAFLFER